jgi:hypothetical protein
MVGPNKVAFCNSSSKYLKIKGSRASDALSPSNRVVQNLNLDFNIIRHHSIGESIQHLTPQGSPLVALAQQGAEHVVQIIAAEPSMGNQRGEPLCRE